MKQSKHNGALIGVGLRHVHFDDVLQNIAPIDFIEVHSENFFAHGGAAPELLQQVSQHYAISLHSTALGLGSQTAISNDYTDNLLRLQKDTNPILMSDHAAFSWAEINGQRVHAADLLPLAFHQKNLQQMSDNIQRLQNKTGQQLLVENICAYISLSGSTMMETDFLNQLSLNTGCGLLIDLNNLVVNAHNLGQRDVLRYGQHWLKQIDSDSVGEIHLAGYTEVDSDQLAIDDHSRPVSHKVWTLYRNALQRFGAVATLIEWDNQIPSWSTLTNEASKAKRIAMEVLA